MLGMMDVLKLNVPETPAEQPSPFPLPPIRSPLTLSEHHLVHLQLDLVEIRLHRGELRRGFLV